MLPLSLICDSLTFESGGRHFCWLLISKMASFSILRLCGLILLSIHFTRSQLSGTNYFDYFSVKLVLRVLFREIIMGTCTKGRGCSMGFNFQKWCNCTAYSSISRNFLQEKIEIHSQLKNIAWNQFKLWIYSEKMFSRNFC